MLIMLLRLMLLYKLIQPLLTGSFPAGQGIVQVRGYAL